MALTKKQREKLRMKFGTSCAYCGCELPEKGWHADHVQAVLRKSEQCMKAAEKRIFRLKSTGDVFQTGGRLSGKPRPGLCAVQPAEKQHIRWRCSERRCPCRLNGGEEAA